jgi:hypothetical protein
MIKESMMALSKKIVLALIAALGVGALQAQNILTDTVTWSVVSAVNQTDQSQFAYACSFITYGANAMDWSQSNGEDVSHYTVTSVNGQWPNVAVDGITTYSVQNGSITGTVTFSSSDHVITVHLQLLVNGKPNQDYVFSVSSVNPQ